MCWETLSRTQVSRCMKDKRALRHSRSTVSSEIAQQEIKVRTSSQGLSTVFSINLPIRTLLFADPPYDIFRFEITSVGSKCKNKKPKQHNNKKAKSIAGESPRGGVGGGGDEWLTGGWGWGWTSPCWSTGPWFCWARWEKVPPRAKWLSYLEILSAKELLWKCVDVTSQQYRNPFPLFNFLLKPWLGCHRAPCSAPGWMLVPAARHRCVRRARRKNQIGTKKNQLENCSLYNFLS